MKQEPPQIQFIVGVPDIPVATQRKVLKVQTAQQNFENPQVQFLGEVVGAPVVVQRLVPWSTSLRHAATGSSSYQ